MRLSTFLIAFLCSTALSFAEADRMGAKLQPITVSAGGIERRALVHAPPTVDAKIPLPVVLMFHGIGGTPELCATETGWVAKADTERFIIVFPAATRPDMKQPPKFGRNNPAWNDGSGRFHAGESKVPDVAFIVALLDQLEAGFPVDKARIFASGFSNGASMTFRVGMELSGRIAAIAPVAGAFWIAEPKAARPVSLLYLTGTKDPLNPLAGGVPRMAGGAEFKGAPQQAKPPVRGNITKWAKLIGSAVEPKLVSNTPDGITTEIYAGGREGTEIVFTTIADQGHIWPGAERMLPEAIVGKATRHLMATDVVWEFFKAHPRPLSTP